MLIGSITNAATSRRFSRCSMRRSAVASSGGSNLAAVRQQVLDLLAVVGSADAQTAKRVSVVTAFERHQPITKSMYFLPRESVTMLPFVAATCSSAGSSLGERVAASSGHEGSFPYAATPTASSWGDQPVLVMRVRTRSSARDSRTFLVCSPNRKKRIGHGVPRSSDGGSLGAKISRTRRAATKQDQHPRTRSHLRASRAQVGPPHVFVAAIGFLARMNPCLPAISASCHRVAAQ